MAACWPRENKSGIKASPCSPPSPCSIVLTPLSLSHKLLEGLLQNIHTNGKTCDPPGIAAKLSSIALRDIKSNADTPSKDMTVAVGSASVSA